MRAARMTSQLSETNVRALARRRNSRVIIFVTGSVECCISTETMFSISVSKCLLQGGASIYSCYCLDFAKLRTGCPFHYDFQSGCLLVFRLNF